MHLLLIYVFYILEKKTIGMHAPIIFVCPNQGTFVRHWDTPHFPPGVRLPGKNNAKRTTIKRLDEISPYHRFVRHSESTPIQMTYPVQYVNVKRLMPKPFEEESKWASKKPESPPVGEEVKDRLGMRNVLERQRRNDLKSRLNVLRQNIPELVNNNDAPQVLILNKAVDYLRELKLKDKKLMLDMALEKSRKMYLLERIQDLLASPSKED